MFGSILTTIVAFTVIGYTSHSAQFIVPKTLAAHEFSMNTRYANSFVNDVFKDNILLVVARMRGLVTGTPVDWVKVEQPFHYTLTLKPGEVFAFHDSVLDQYKGKAGFTTRSHFNSGEGFKSDGYLVGDGVCHLASLMYWVAKDAGLDAVRPTSHDFATIQGVPQEYGVAIYDSPGMDSSSALQNLYITNNKEKTIAFVFDYDGTNLKISTVEDN